MHDDEVRITAGTVRGLVAEQHPQWAALPVEPVAGGGTVNAVFRLGHDLAARFPLRRQDPDAVLATLARETVAAHEIASCSTVPTPRPVAIGGPGAGYPMPWSVQTWLPGRVASEEDPAASEPFARDLAALVLRLRAADTRGRTFSGDGRGGRLDDHDAWVEESLRRSGHLVDVPAVRALWQELRGTPRSAPDVMTHGDLVPGNVLVADGRLTGVLDVGGFGPADPALELVAVWHLLDDGPRRVVRDLLGSGDDEWARGMAWALQQAIGALWYYESTNPPMHRMGRITLERLLAAR